MTLKQFRQTLRSLLKRPPIAILAIVGAIIYSIFHRTPQEYFVESFPIAAFLTITSYGYFIMRWTIFGIPKISIHLFLLPVLYLPIIIIGLTAVYYGIWVTFQDGYLWFQHKSPPRIVYLSLVGIAVMLIGYTLFQIRLHARFFFGLSESLVGVLIALRNVPTNADPTNWNSDIFVLMLTASVFLIVRGFDNMHTGLKPESKDSILKEIMASEYGDFFKANPWSKNNES